jgi:hypothetical protein
LAGNKLCFTFEYIRNYLESIAELNNVTQIKPTFTETLEATRIKVPR